MTALAHPACLTDGNEREHMGSVPIVDVSPLRAGADPAGVAAQIDAACRDVGFFCVTGHGVDAALGDELDALARAFFALPEATKAQISMARGGRAWRGWFPVGDELTSGRPDRKEGLYFGEELAADDPRVRSGRPLHGPNLFPAEPAGLRRVVPAWMAEMRSLARDLMRAIGIGLGVGEQWFERHLTGDPITLFRVFHYPPDASDGWGVGEHTDYGLLTVLKQDACGGLSVKTRTGWIDVPPEPDVFVCNIGDMLDRMTGGRYRSTPHRVRNTSGRSRLSFPFFFDPGWDAQVRPLPGSSGPADEANHRWDGADVHQWHGTYGEYLMGKVAKVFPELRAQVAPP